LFFQTRGQNSPTVNADIHKLVSALIKTSTKRPMHRQKPLQISAFTDVFHEMESDDQLTLKVLRMKAITLLALVTMTRPSVLAPKGKQFNVRSQSFDPVIMSRDDVHFEDDGTMTVKFWSIKNDTNRQGFKVNVPPSNDTKCDPVQCLKTYIDRTN